MSFRRILPVLMLALLLASPARAFEGWVQNFGQNGTIAWGSGEISVARELVGSGEENALPPLALRRAVSQARKQMLDMVLDTRIDARQTVRGYLSGNSELSDEVRGLMQNSPYQAPTMLDGTGSIRVFEKFRGLLADLTLPTTIQFQSDIPPRMSTAEETEMELPSNAPEEVGSGTRGYTGLVVDARGLKVTPALCPVIYGQDGFGAYGAFFVSRTSAVNKGVAAYSVSDDPAVLGERVGDRPLTVRALQTYGSWQTDLVISTPDARLVRALARAGSAVRDCRVVILVDSPKTLDSPDSGEVTDQTIPQSSDQVAPPSSDTPDTPLPYGSRHIEDTDTDN